MLGRKEVIMSRFMLGNVRVVKPAKVRANSNGSHTVTLMVAEGEDNVFFLQEYVAPDKDVTKNRLYTRIIGEALNVEGEIGGRIYQNKNGGNAYAMNLNVHKLTYLNTKEQRKTLWKKHKDKYQQAVPVPQEEELESPL